MAAITAPATTAPAPAIDGVIPQSLAGRRLGRYEVLCQLASGGMASVYVARAQGVAGFERLVAVKVLHPHLAHEEEFISMFLDEARLAARIRHPNVVATLDISDTEGQGFFIVMDYIEGHHLGAILQSAAKQQTRVPVAVAARCVVDALAGLGAAHDLTDESGKHLNLVHRDVSPHNVMVGADGGTRLTDFGVAKAEDRLTATRDGQFKGKLAYMAPEHASTGRADQRSDLFAMGIILWEGLTGRRLFRADTNQETLHKILVADIPLPSSVSPALAPWDPVLAKALARPPEERFQSAHEFGEAIELVARSNGGLASPRAVGEAVRQFCAEKLGRDRERIQAAMNDLGRSEGARGAMPIPRDGSEPSMPSMPSRSGSGVRRAPSVAPPAFRTGGTSPGAPLSGLTPLPAPAATPDFAPISVTIEREPPSKRVWVLGGIGVALVLVLGAGVVVLATRGGGEPTVAQAPAPVVVPMPVVVPSAPPPVAPVAPAVEPTPAVVAEPAVAPEVPAPRADGDRRRGRRGGDTQASPAPTAEPSTPAAAPPTPRPRPAQQDDDDLLLSNPYRH